MVPLIFGNSHLKSSETRICCGFPQPSTTSEVQEPQFLCFLHLCHSSRLRTMLILASFIATGYTSYL